MGNEWRGSIGVGDGSKTYEAKLASSGEGEAKAGFLGSK
jgi:hypothetical protein